MYYVVIIQNDSSQAVYRYNNYDDAIAMFHQELAYRGEGRNKTVAVVLNDFGACIKSDNWVRHTELNLNDSGD